MKVIIIGSGLGGLATAIRLQAQGHQVTILEKRDRPGGRAYVYQQDGFTFDGGPTIITSPYLIHELFQIAGKRTEDYLKLVKLDPFYKVRFPDGSVFNYNDNTDNLIQQIRAFNPKDVAGYQRFCQAANQVFEKGLPLMTQPFTTWGDMLKVAPDMMQLQAYKSVAGF
ncbi:MAG: FAD-dependent oxidoreductase, partial [Cyanobacteriota bacterium]|nr:FAD-dependent oxidoreductase [Cyanobacteriota bacterium]